MASKYTVGQRQRIFSLLIAKLIIKAYELGYEVSCGDFKAAKRTPLEHKENSLHYLQCAADLNLFRDGVYLTKSSDHKPLGDYWESLHPLCRWGGRWNDGNHYELRPSAKGGEAASE